MDNPYFRYGLLTVLLVGTVVAIIFLEGSKTAVNSDFRVETLDVDLSEDRVVKKAERYERAKEITTPDGFINVENIAIENLVGKQVILVDFWTYSCINCQRTTPYLNAWYDTYRDQGLEIIGIHTPEFMFEQEYENVAAAVEQFGIEFPVVLDNDFSTWRAYENRYWPRKYLIDIDGFIVYDHIGEGGYEETEEMIQALLAERATVLGEELIMPQRTSDVAAIDVDFSQVESPEIYFGANRNEHLGNGEQGVVGDQLLAYVDKEEKNTLYLNGPWQIEKEYATASAESGVRFSFEAKYMYMVASGDATVRILIDGEDQGTIRVTDEALYQLAELEDYGRHTMEIIIESGSIDVYTFTFG